MSRSVSSAGKGPSPSCLPPAPFSLRPGLADCRNKSCAVVHSMAKGSPAPWQSPRGVGYRAQCFQQSANRLPVPARLSVAWSVSRRPICTKDGSIDSSRPSGRFFVGLAALSAGLSFFAFHSKEWWRAVTLLAIALFFGLIGWVAVTNTVPFSSRGGGGGKVEACCPVPVKPSPTHHLAAARDLPA